MNVKGYSRIPNELFYWITFLTKVLPLRSVGTFLELLIGAMLTPTGFVTEAYLIWICVTTGQVITSGYSKESGHG